MSVVSTAEEWLGGGQMLDEEPAAENGFCPWGTAGAVSHCVEDCGSYHMVMKLDEIVPFGRSMDEYKNMFALSDSDLNKNILGVGDGPASFNAEMSALGKSVVSVDPLYRFQSDEIERRFYSVVDDIIAQVKATPDDWVWSYHGSPSRLRDRRVNALRNFVSDYEQGRLQGRYIIGALPVLDFKDDAFQLAICSHLLFLFSDQLTYEFHRISIMEMLRVASEVRIFPLLTHMLERSPYIQPLMEQFKAEGFVVDVQQVSYELQRGGNEMLRIKRMCL